MPPQVYELKRMHNFKDLLSLSTYSMHRQKYGVQPWLPKFTKDLKMGILAGIYLMNQNYIAISNDDCF